MEQLYIRTYTLDTRRVLGLFMRCLLKSKVFFTQNSKTKISSNPILWTLSKGKLYKAWATAEQQHFRIKGSKIFGTILFCHLQLLKPTGCVLTQLQSWHTCLASLPSSYCLFGCCIIARGLNMILTTHFAFSM